LKSKELKQGFCWHEFVKSYSVDGGAGKITCNGLSIAKVWN
jgi:hypothetical protein